MAVQVASLFGVLSLRDEQFQQGMDNAKREMTTLSGNLRDMGGRMQDFGVSLTAMTAPLAIGIGAAVKGSSDFGSAMSNVGAILGKNRDEMAGLNAEVLAIGSDSVAGPQAAAEAFAEIAGGVADASTHMGIFKAAIATSEAGMADLQVTTGAIVATMNSYGFAADKAGHVSDVLTQTINMGVGSMEQFASAFPQVTGLANTLNISFGDLGAQMAFLSTKGNTASQSATQLQAMMTAMLNPNERMKKALQELGFASGSVAVEQLGLVGAYEKLYGLLGMDELSKATGSAEALRGALALVGDGADEFFDTFAAGIDGATESMRAIQLEDPAAQFKLLMSQVQGLGIEVGNNLMPVLVDLVKEVKPVISAITGWVRENPQLVRQILMIAGGLVVLGPIVAGIGAAMATLGTIIGFIASPIGLVVAAVAALALAFETNFLGIRDLLQPVIDRVQTFVGFIQGAVTTLQGQGVAVDLWQYLFGQYEDGSSNLQEMLMRVFGLSEDAAGSVRDQIASIAESVRSVIDVLVNAFQALSAGVPPMDVLFEALARLFGPETATQVLTFVDGLVTGFGQIVSWIQTNVLPVLGTLADWFINTALPAVVAFIRDTVIPAVGDFIELLKGIWDAISPALGDLFTWFTEEALPEIKRFIEEDVTKAINAFIDLLKGIWDAISPGLQDLYTWFTEEALPEVKRFIEEDVTNAINNFIGLLQGIWSTVQPKLEEFKNGIKAIFDWIKANVIDPIIQAFGEMITKAGEVLGKIGEILSAAGQSAGDLGGIIGGLLSGQWSLEDVGRAAGMGSWASGGYTGMGAANEVAGVVHRGEFVVPQNGALVVRSEGGAEGMRIDNVVIYANSQAEGAAAAAGFEEELMRRRRARG